MHIAVAHYCHTLKESIFSYLGKTTFVIIILCLLFEVIHLGKMIIVIILTLQKREYLLRENNPCHILTVYI